MQLWSARVTRFAIRIGGLAIASAIVEGASVAVSHNWSPYVDASSVVPEDDPSASARTRFLTRHRLRRIATVVGIFAVTLILDLRSTVSQDETWLWWVTHRVLSGDVLYRDVYFVTTPLAVWTTTAASAVFGSQLLVMRAVVTATFVAEVVFAVAIVKRFGVSKYGQILLAVALFVAGSPLVVNNALYTTLAIFFALAALHALVVWQAGDDAAHDPRRRLVLLGMVGVWCGLSFGSKPNVGLLALAAALFAVAVARSEAGRAIWWNLASVSVGWVVTTVVIVIPVVVMGSWDGFVDQVFADKGDYISVGFSYTDALERRVGIAFGSGPSIDLRARWKIVVMLLPVACVIAAAFAVWRARGDARRRVLGLAAFIGVAIASVYPRPGTNNFTDTMPLALTATVAAVAASRRGERTRRVLPIYGLAATVGLIGLYAVTAHAIGESSQPSTTSAADPFTDVPISLKTTRLARELGSLLRSRSGGQVFIVRQDAAVWYFTTGLRNPLPYDYPQVSDFGGAGERGVIRRLAQGAAPWVCLQNSRATAPVLSDLQPRMIERWVRRHDELVQRLPVCDLYATPSQATKHRHPARK